MNTRKTPIDVATLKPVRRPLTRSTNIYWLIDTRTGLPFYCGKTVLPLERRLCCHKQEAVKGTRRVHARVRECGDNLHVRLMETVPADGDWGAREKHWIAILRHLRPDCCNTANGGAGTPGRILSDTTKAKIVTANRGRKHTPETRAKLSAVGTGRKRSPESVEKGRAKMLGRKLTPEQRANLSAKQKARFAGPQGDELRRDIGLRRKGVVASAETRAKQSAAKIGMKHTPEAIAKMSAASRDRKQSPEAIAKSAASRTGQKRTPEQRARMSAAHKGKPWSQAQRDAIPAGLRASWARRKSA